MTSNEIVLVESLDRNPAAAYLASLSRSSRITMLQALDVIADVVAPGCTAATFPWHSLRYPHVVVVRARLAEMYSAATASKMLCALRRTMREAWRLDLIDAETYQKIKEVEGIRGETLPAGRAVGATELTALWTACQSDPGPSGTRDVAILSLGYGCGLRRAEIVGLDLADYDAETLTIRGKRNKERLAHVVGNTAVHLRAWIAVRGADPGPLFLPILKNDRIVYRRLTTQAIYYILQRRADQAGVTSLSPHDLRRSFVSDLLDEGADLATVQRLAGHASVITTTRYDRRGEDAKRAAVELLHVP